MRRWLAVIRPEERILIGLWLVGLLLCVSTGTGGVQLASVFHRYVGFFGAYFVYLFLASRLLFWLAERWRPRGHLASHVYAWVFGAEPAIAPAAPTQTPLRIPIRILDRLLLRGGAQGQGRPDVAAREVAARQVAAVDRELARGAFLLFANLTVYSNVKVRIPFISGTVGDASFRAMDEALFGSLIGDIERWFATSPGVARYFAEVYLHDYIWFVVLLLILYARRDRFAIRWAIASVCVVYLLGILMTAAYPSYGPCFLEPERFAWLHGTDIGGAQRMLMRFYGFTVDTVNAGRTFEAQPFLGIAAFPSLHVAHMVVVGLVALRTVPLYAAWMLWVTVATFIATIGFGWHYAVDGAGGIALAVVFTEGLYRMMRRWDAAPDNG